MSAQAHQPQPSRASNWDEEIELLARALPPDLARALHERIDPGELLEIVLDLGREPEARVPGREVLLADHPVSTSDLDHVANNVGQFGDDNRAGIERTLHRVSAIRNRSGRIVGLTMRVGRAVTGTGEIIRDIVISGQSILLLGRPGIGKTTMLRECARLLADELRKRVVIVDTSNEIGGDGDIPHPGIGRARRMQVRTPMLQHAVMIEAVENHMPEVIVIDEIGTELEAAAARTIAERGVQLVATAHGNELENLMMNPTLSDLVVEIQSWERVAVHGDVAETVDSMLRGYQMPAEVRELGEDDEIRVIQMPTAIGPPARRDRGMRDRGYARSGNGAAGDRGFPTDGPFRRIYPF